MNICFHDYSVNIDGKYGEYGSIKSDGKNENWKKSKKISAQDNELTYTELKQFIKNNIEKYI